MSDVNRREFVKTSIAAAAAMGTASFSINALGANERVIVGLMGAHGRGSFLGPEFAKRKDVELRYIADPDMRNIEARAKDVENVCGKAPQTIQDFRRILDDPEIDGVVQATPDHWHALGTILACQAGKDVYVEKPTSHSIWESRKMIEAARKYDRVVQVGAQNRSAAYCYAAIEHINSGAFGDVHFVRVLNSKLRPTIGKLENTPVPEGVDYDMWLGPAPMREFNENHFHYAWHWFWAYSGGDIINDGVHQMDIARWLAGVKLPKSAVSGGGIYYYDDDQETPDTHTVSWDFDGMTMAFEQILWAPYMKKTPMEIRDADVLPTWPWSGTRIEVYGTKQMMFFGRHGGGWEAYDADGKSYHIEHGGFSDSNDKHIANFVECIRDRKRPSGDIEELHYSTLLCHYGNIAYRVGRKVTIDPATEGFVGDDEANALVRRTYRDPWVIPDAV